MLEEATQALARFDSEALDRITAHALKITEQLHKEILAMPLPEVAARLRLFAQLIEVTGRQLDLLAPNQPVAGKSSGVDLWAR